MRLLDPHRTQWHRRLRKKKGLGRIVHMAGGKKKNLVVERSRGSVQRIEPESGRDYSLAMALLKKLKGRTPTQSGAEALRLTTHSSSEKDPMFFSLLFRISCKVF